MRRLLTIALLSLLTLGSGAGIAEAQSAYTYPVWDLPTTFNGTVLYCTTFNPSCSNTPYADWWTEWNHDQSEEFAQYRLLGPGLVTERRFVEAIGMLEYWPEGVFLLKQAANAGVRIYASDHLDDAYAVFHSCGGCSAPTILVNSQFVETSTWMLADVLAHELKHAADYQGGVIQGRTWGECIQREKHAYEVESRFLKALATNYRGLPSLQQVSSRLSPEDVSLYRNLSRIEASRDPDAVALADYRNHCGS